MRTTAIAPLLSAFNLMDTEEVAALAILHEIDNVKGDGAVVELVTNLVHPVGFVGTLLFLFTVIKSRMSPATTPVG